jgi:hypothetical protein
MKIGDTTRVSRETEERPGRGAFAHLENGVFAFALLLNFLCRKTTRACFWMVGAS